MNRSIWSIVSRLRKPDDPSSDAMVLSRYVQHRDANAFELLVWRHGSFVLSVCKRILVDEHAAEDAFQATFFILARKAPSIRGSLVGWLHLVAKRVSLRLKRKTRKSTAVLEEEMAVDSSDAVFPGELARVIDEEIGRLPEKLRLPVILCYLQGRSTEEVAQTLGIPRGTVLSRLHHAKKRLQDLLQHRGIVAPATFLASAVALPSLSADFCRSLTSEAITFFNTSVATTVPTQIAQEFLVMATRKTVFGMAAAMVLTAGLGTGVSFVLAQGDGKKPAPAGQTVAVSQGRDEVKQIASEVPKGSIEQLEKKRNLLDRKMEIINKQIMGRFDVIDQIPEDLSIDILAQALIRFDNQLFDLEVALTKVPLDMHHEKKRDIEAAIAGKLENASKLKHFDAMVRSYASENKLVKEYLQRFQESQAAHFQYTQTLQPDSARTEAEFKRMNNLKVAYEKAIDSLIPTIKKECLNVELSRVDAEIEKCKSQLSQLKQNIASMHLARKSLAIRISEATRANKSRQMKTDETEVLREVRTQLYKELLLTEMAIEDLRK